MPRSRSRKKPSGRDSRSTRVPDSLILLHLLEKLDVFEADGQDAEIAQDGETANDLLLLDAFDRAAWSFHAGPDAWYLEAGSVSRELARLRAREWFLFEFELPSGLTAAEEWVLQREGEPGSGGERRAVERFVNSECGVFDVDEVRADGWLRLLPALGGDSILARPIERGGEMVPGPRTPLPVFKNGDTFVGRLYWLDEKRAELSAGADRISAEARESLLADPPGPSALRSGLVVESLFGADAGRLLSLAADVRFPRLVDDLLAALSDGTFDYRRLWRELENEADPVAVARQLLAELDEWTVVEQELLACGVVGAWLRRREARAGRPITPETFARERGMLEEHLRTVLDVPRQPELRLAADTPRMALPPEDEAEIAALPTDPTEWVVDVRRDDWPMIDRILPSASPFPLVCAFVEQDISAFDDVGGGEEGGAGAADFPRDADADEFEGSTEPSDDDLDEDDLGEDDLGPDDLDEDEVEEGTGAEEEGAPRLIQKAPIGEGDNEAAVALRALADALLAGEAPLPRPRRIVFRQRHLAAVLAETLRDAGFDLALRYFTEVVDVATMDVGPSEVDEAAGPHLADSGKRPAAAGQQEGAPGISEEERRLHQRLLQATERARSGLEGLASVTRESGTAPIIVAPAAPLEFPFATLEGQEDRVQAFAVVPRSGREGLAAEIFLLPPAVDPASRFAGGEGEALLDPIDRMTIELGDIEKLDERDVREMEAAGWPCAGQASCLLAVRQRPDAPRAFLRGRALDVAAGVMEAVAALTARVGDDAEWDEPAAVDTRVEPLGEAAVSWRPSS